MNRVQTLAALAALSIFASFSSAAQAQLALQNGAFVSTSNTPSAISGVTKLDLGNAGANTAETLVTRMPLSLTYGSVTANLAFTGSSGVFDGGSWAPGPENYLIAKVGGSVTLSFSSTQNYFGTKWMSKDAGNQFSFYNGNQLVASTTGAAVSYSKPYVDFNFTEIGYDRVVASTAGGSVEFGAISFSENVQVAPIPLNAASLGGLMSFLMMLAMRGKHGPQVAIRMAFASIMPRRRALA